LDLKEKYGLSMDIYEISELGNLYAMKTMANNNVPCDYGTGEMYTSVEAHTITNIYLNPGITAKEISEKTARTQSAVSQIVSKLSLKGLLKTEKDSEDNRRTCLYVTEKGEELAKAHIAYDERAIGKAIETLIEKMGTDAMENFIQIFSYMTNDKGW